MERDVYIERLVGSGYRPKDAVHLVDSYYAGQDLDALEDAVTAAENALEVG